MQSHKFSHPRGRVNLFWKKIDADKIGPNWATHYGKWQFAVCRTSSTQQRGLVPLQNKRHTAKSGHTAKKTFVVCQESNTWQRRHLSCASGLTHGKEMSRAQRAPALHSHETDVNLRRMSNGSTQQIPLFVVCLLNGSRQSTDRWAQVADHRASR